MRRWLPVIQRVVAFLGIGLSVAAIALFIIAAASSGSDCTFDHVSCRRNVLLGTGLRCLIAAAVTGVVWAALWKRRKRPE